jgi:hypothetical protein
MTSEKHVHLGGPHVWTNANNADYRKNGNHLEVFFHTQFHQPQMDMLCLCVYLIIATAKTIDQ